jgi:CheY-like chemotaxis protein
MPVLDGIEAAIRIRKLLPECRLLLMSGNLRTTELWQNARRLGHEFELLEKPIPPEGLLTHLGAII